MRTWTKFWVRSSMLYWFRAILLYRGESRRADPGLRPWIRILPFQPRTIPIKKFQNSKRIQIHTKGGPNLFNFYQICGQIFLKLPE
jgi:hypothetical protein